MEAALTAAQRGHQVTLCEADDRLGGQLLCEEYVPFKRELFDFCRLQADRVERAGVEIRLNTRVDRTWAQDFGADVIISAIGARPIVPPMEGIDLPHVKFLSELRKEKPDFGHRVVILGGGLVGCETAAHLLQKGHQVTLVEMQDDYAPDATIWHKQALRLQLADRADIRLNTRAVRITEAGVVVQAAEGEQTIPADTVFCAVGLCPRSEERDALIGAAPLVYPIGDCLQPAQMFQALSQGHFVGRDI